MVAAHSMDRLARNLDDLLKRRDNGKTTRLRQSPAKPNSRHMLEHRECSWSCNAVVARSR